MAEKTAIAWTRSSFNPWIGCTRVGPGCDHCYAEALDKRMRYGGAVHWGSGVERMRTSFANWKDPLRWNSRAARGDRPWRVFCASLADVFDNEVPGEWRVDLWSLIQRCSHLDWLLVTKRIGNVAHMIPEEWLARGFPASVRLLITVCNQEEADRDIPKLLALPCKNGVSYEPALGSVDWTKWLGGEYNPIYEDHSYGTRRSDLSGGSIRRTGDRLGRSYLEVEKTSLESVEAGNCFNAVSQSESGERHRRLSPDSRDGEPASRSHDGAPTRISALSRSNSFQSNGESQGRKEKTECSEQSGAGDLHGATTSRSPCLGDGSISESGRGEKRDGEVDIGTGHSNSQSPRGRGRTIANSEGLRDHVPGCVEDSAQRTMGKICWLIIGGESTQGAGKARPFDLAWARSTIAQCKAAGVPCFVKQLGSLPCNSGRLDWPEYGRLKDRAGADPAEWPEDLRVQQFP